MLNIIPASPAAVAQVRGGTAHPGICGTVQFFTRNGGTLVSADICGLPETQTNFFAFHIHEGRDCGGTDFADTGSHFNPGNTPHPLHAGDLPPLLGCGGKARLTFFTNRFCVRDIIGRTVIIHENPDDFHTQPSGNAGKKLACGVIHRCG